MRGAATYRLGVDVGGTHTDLVLLEVESGRLMVEKVPSTPRNPALGVLAGIARFAAKGIDPASIGFFSHGTTITTNALLEMRGASVGLLITKGFRAVQEVQNQARDTMLFDYFYAKPVPIAPQSLTKEIAERCDHAGSVLVPLDRESVRRAVRELKQARVRSIAVCYLFSYANPAHEEETRRIIAEEFPDASVSLSSEVLPRIREWPRMSSTLLNAYLEPVLVGYIAHLNKGLDEAGIVTQQRYLMQSNGGVMPFSATIAGGRTVHTLFSGPAAGAQASAYLNRQDAQSGLVSLDMGGTSADIAFIEGGAPLEVTEGTIARRQLDVPALDMTSISAGGGSTCGRRRRRLPDGGSRERRRRTRARVLRPRRLETDRDGCGSDLRLPQSRLLPRRHADARHRRRAHRASDARRRAAEAQPARSGVRYPPHRRSAHGGRDPRVCRQARRGSVVLHAAAVRRRGRCARGRRCRRTRHAAHPGAGTARRLLGAGPAVHRCRARLHPLGAGAARGARSRPRGIGLRAA